MTKQQIISNDVAKILEDINEEFYHRAHENRTELVQKAAQKLEEIGLPKRTICAELVKHLRFASKTSIYRILGPEYRREQDLSHMEQNDDNNAIEEDAKKVREIHGIDEEDDKPSVIDDAVVKTLEEKLKQVTYERDYYREQYDIYKGLYETLLRHDKEEMSKA